MIRLQYGVLVVVLTAGCQEAPGGAAVQAETDNARGWMDFSGNELTVASKEDDPSAIRLGAVIGDRGGLGKVSFNRMEGTEAGVRQVEACIIVGSYDNGGEMSLQCVDPYGQEDANMKKMAIFRWDGIEWLVPLKNGGAGPAVPAVEIQSPSDTFRLTMQDDGSVVRYRRVQDGWVGTVVFEAPH